MARGMARVCTGWGLRATAWAVGPLAAVLLLAWWGTGGAGAAGEPVASDSSNLRGAPAYAGLVCSLAVMLWSAVTVFCFCRAAMQRSIRAWTFFAMAGLITTIPLLDDVLMASSAAIARMLGMTESVAYIAYAAVTGMYLLAFRRRILSGAVAPLAGALGLFATAMMLDLLLPAEAMLADSIRVLGIGCWGTYFAARARTQQAVEQALVVCPRAEALTGSAAALGVLAECAREAADRRDQARADRLPDIIAVTTQAWSIPPKVTVRAWRRAA